MMLIKKEVMMLIKYSITLHLFLLSLLLLPQSVNSQIIFQDNFDGFISGWTPSTGSVGWHLFPWTTNENYDYTDGLDSSNGGGFGSITDYEPSIYSSGSRTNINSWNGWSKDTYSDIEIVSSGGRNNTPCLKFTFDKMNGLTGETGLFKWLGPTSYNELYIRYYFKFDDNFAFCGSSTSNDPDCGSVIWKAGRVWTGFNPIDYDKTGGQSYPAVNTVPSFEDNWMSGIWIWRMMWNSWQGLAGKPYYDVAFFTGTNSGSPSRGEPNGNIMDFANDAASVVGTVTYAANSNTALTSDGEFSEAQVWHSVEYHFKNSSSPGAGDGVFEMWIDGDKVSDHIDSDVDGTTIKAAMSTNANDYGMNLVILNDNRNNLTEMIPASPGSVNYYIDDIVISTSPIGEDLAFVPPYFKLISISE